MATTWIKALHTGKGRSMLSTLVERTDYAIDSKKTEDGHLVSAYECGEKTAASEFQLAKRQYTLATGREQGHHDVIAYHIRQSFKPGEVSAAEANAIGYELALAFTRGQHQFIVATHTNTNSVHSHIIFNSTNLECDHKFADFKHSAIALRRVSDRICLEHGLSVIEKPGLSPGRNYAKLRGGEKAPSARDRLRALIDSSLPGCRTFEDFIAAMEMVGAIVKRGKHLAFRIPSGERFVRCKSLGEDYTEEALHERIGGERVVEKVTLVTIGEKPNLLIDIQAKLQQGKGEGYRRWANGFNLKQMARTLVFLQESGVESFEALAETADAATAEFDRRLDSIKADEKRMAEISELQKHIGAYKRTLDVYREYRAGGQRENYYNEHAAELLLHKAARVHFDSISSNGSKKLPSMQSLRREYAVLAVEKKKQYAGYKKVKENMAVWQTARKNVELLIGGERRNSSNLEMEER